MNELTRDELFSTNTISLRLARLLCFTSFALFFSQNCLAEMPPELVFELKTLVDKEPTYFIHIFSDGKIHYHGVKTAVVGDRYAHITQEQLDELTLYFLALPFDSSKKNEWRRPAMRGGPSSIDYKSAHTRIYTDDPIFKMALMKKLDTVIDLRQWFCFPKDHPEYFDHCMENNVPVDLNELRNYYQ